jgi:hypothetical protein
MGSLYRDTWNIIKTLTLQETEEQLKIIGTPAGIDMDFQGLRVNDVDLHEYLDIWKEELLSARK